MADVTIKVRKNGPYLVTGPVVLTDADGNQIPIPNPDRPFTLCRCGASSKKPFCDGTHSRIGFIGAEMARDVADRLEAERAERERIERERAAGGGG